MPKPGFHQAMRALTEEFGILLIFDEVKTGFRFAKRRRCRVLRHHARTWRPTPRRWATAIRRRRSVAARRS